MTTGITTNTEIATYIASTNAVSRAAAERILADAFDFIRDSLGEGKEVQIRGFGKFRTSTLAERQGINPSTKEPITIPASTVVRFKPFSKLKDEVK